ncbi:MAG: ABC-type multidrug transport system, ATPase and permease component [Deltaproteobacteria bacterium]|nr:ABC-type multidrug transport system, ATPase and permease component [Deltaproteobacteria bacterium]MBS1244641.1 ABC-type multidrug transport system, ATPase and permease component [Deltaproteobacteria bacterium]
METPVRSTPGSLRILARLFGNYMVGEWRRVALGLFLLLAASGTALLQPWPLKMILDGVVGDAPTHPWVAAATSTVGGWIGRPSEPKVLLLFLCGCLLLIHAISGALKVLHTYVLVSAGLRMKFRLRCDMFHHLQRLSLAFHNKASAGDSLYRVTSDTDSVHIAFNHGIVPAIGAMITLLGIACIMLMQDSMVAVAAILMGVPLVLLISAFDRLMTERAERVNDRESEVTSSVQETLDGITAVQAFCREDFENARFRRRAGDSLRADLKLNMLQTGSQSLIDLVLAGGIAVIVWIASMRVLQGRMTAGDVVLVISYIWMLYEPLQEVSYTVAYVQMAAGGARRAFDLLDTSPDISDIPGAVVLPGRPAGRIVFEEVSFRYSAGRPVLHGVNLEIPAGSSLALVGSSGAGKTTLAGLVMRFHDPTSGRVALDGRDLRSITLVSLRRSVSLVSQDPILFDASIRENIAYGRPEASLEEIRLAAAQAGAHEFIEALPGKYDTRIGRRGMTLSGGQRQRIAIARAFLKDAPVLVLDEPTSALDSENEILFLETLGRLAKGRTTLVIAHRLSMARWADRIVVLKGGRIAESGSHKELVAQGGVYQRFHRLQAMPERIHGDGGVPGRVS